MSRRWAAGVTTAVFALAVLFGCGSGTTPSPPSAVPADLLLSPDDLPAGFTPAQLSVADLVASNQGAVDSAESAGVDPPECRPTADAELNAQLTAGNAAVLAARASGSGLVELVTTARRDIDSDIRVTTGICATTTTTIHNGDLRGTRIVTRYSELPMPDSESESGRSEAIEQSLVLRSVVTTTLPDGGVRAQVGYAGYAALDRPGTGSVTVQLTVSGEATPAGPAPAEPVEPMSAAEFSALFGQAVSAAAG